ncbi:Galactose oxidase/kelch repeat superfamily protein [Actinidia rufa]|uniref:Galactose oxidase/kelch repeat superfamily protein n=1 Tax=Actinidia rufa TaxID=165716 RepID=A0A7J0FZM0_9ERIC|nr:Galactose oxidase/kelch repeat superfamily protein [Actinidia rufa]
MTTSLLFHPCAENGRLRWSFRSFEGTGNLPEQASHYSSWHNHGLTGINPVPVPGNHPLTRCISSQSASRKRVSGASCYPIPGYSNGLPVFCRVTSVGSNLVVMGGLDPVTWEVSNAVFVYNFVAATWKRGTDMPGGPRSFFACASDLDRTVYVAGGHDKEKNALRSAMAYDVANDEWVHLPDMAMDRDECKGVFHGGKFHVIGGYNTEMQGQFGTSAEAFSIATWKWDLVNDDFLDTAACSSTCSDGGDGRLYMCRANEVVVLQGTTWKTVAELPVDVRRWTTDTWQGRMFVMGCRRFGEAPQSLRVGLEELQVDKCRSTRVLLRPYSVWLLVGSIRPNCPREICHKTIPKISEVRKWLAQKSHPWRLRSSKSDSAPSQNRY